ncbi:MAG TPA: hypothetical protein VKA19_09165 [Alphaproteobacteria bacterium]|nr:hypothetical protein [Alphaproteobacteria bacterium]
MPLWRAKRNRAAETEAVEQRVSDIEKTPHGNLSLVTLLATDYLNHFVEIIMLIELLPEMPDLAEECRDWKPLTYEEHFAKSQIADRDLARQAYALVPERYRTPFEATSDKLHGLVQDYLEKILKALDGDDKARTTHLCLEAVYILNGHLQTLNGIIHGGEFVLDQKDIDQLVHTA